MAKKWIAILASAASLWASAGRADDQDTGSDVRCLLVSMNMTQLQNPSLQAAGMMSVMYWMGRLDGRTPDLDLEDRLIAELKAMNPEEFQATAQRCGAALQMRGKAMSDMGADMRKKGVEMQQQENTH